MEQALATKAEYLSPSIMTPMDMLDKAIQQNADIAVLEKLMGLQERWQANQARKAFDEAMASAKAEIPNISKNRTVDFTSQKGRTNYRYEDLGEVAKTVSPILAKYGLSYRFRTASPVNEPVTVTCIVSHREGHFEENTLCAGRDDSGNKNSIQAIGSTLTYLQRMTLKAALGLAATIDDDGANADGKPEVITIDQVGELVEMIESKGADKARFLKYYKVEKLADLPAAKFDSAVKLLMAKGG
ncbi:MAG: hypothetical protein JWO37_4140 [Acidimicrobiales bacterium]|nr:hypothetical protein [Acidimicrobiales bacterium]